MKTPFKYKSKSIHQDESDRKNGMILLDKPQAGDYVVQYTHKGEILAEVKHRSDSASKVSRYLNRRNIDFNQHWFTWEE
jgi:hypothetical protein